MSISSRTELLEENADIEQLVHGCPRIVTGVGRPKTSEHFKDIVRNIKKKHVGNTIDI